MILVTGGAGFIGSNFVLDWLSNPTAEGILNLDKLTYAGHLCTLQVLENDARHIFVRGDICDTALVLDLLREHQVSAVIHFAAESHVDRSIDKPGDFIQANVMGTFHLLEAVRKYWSTLSHDMQKLFRFLHISTDEVYGSLGRNETDFTEANPFRPNSPYSASKASSDHLVRAWHQTYSLPTLTINCSNNYGPYQFPEKLIPYIIHEALLGRALPIFGDGQQVRDWLYVIDHCAAICQVLVSGRVGEAYNIGGGEQRTNLEVVQMICTILDDWMPKQDHSSYKTQIQHVADRPGHDHRYGIDSTKLRKEFGWKPVESFESGLKKTVYWYLTNRSWTEQVLAASHHDKYR
jgi:dTDP-glucose 4,6-dehydratase